MATSLVLPAPAKINLFLHIIGRRDDGYHLLQTLFQFLDYGDELSFELSDDLTLSCNKPELEGSDNLIIKAGQLLQRKTGCCTGAKITLQKNLPMGGGVGGGSSDAATTLLALNALWQLGLSMDELADTGLQLGADVPVFVRGQTAFAEGVGEVLTPVDAPETWYLVVAPDVHVDTTRMYNHESLTRDTPPINVCAALEQSGQNDFEPLVRQLHPEIDQWLSWLSQLDTLGLARMSGSGACVFAPFTSHRQATEAQHLLESMAGTKVTSFVTQGRNQSPLHKVLKKKGYPIPE